MSKLLQKETKNPKQTKYFFIELLERTRNVREELTVVPVAKPVKAVLCSKRDGSNIVYAIGVDDPLDVFIVHSKYIFADNLWESRVYITILSTIDFEKMTMREAYRKFDECKVITLDRVLRL